jgi:membrane-associated HD superfamily phosphohydrolase
MCGMLVGNSNSLTSSQIDRLAHEQLVMATKNQRTPAILKGLVGLGMLVFVLSQREDLAPILGWGEQPSLIVYLLWTVILTVLAFIGASLTNVIASLIYLMKTGRKFVEDRVGYARSGGLDIVFWAPIVSILVLGAAFAWAHQSAGVHAISLLRGPWIFLLYYIPLTMIIGALAAVGIMRRR